MVVPEYQRYVNPDYEPKPEPAVWWLLGRVLVVVVTLVVIFVIMSMLTDGVGPGSPETQF